MPRIVIIDNSLEFLASAGAMLSEEGFDVVGSVSDASMALGEVRRLRPAVVLLDVQMPLMSGLELARQLATLHPTPILVLISSRDAASYGPELLRAPVRGFIAKRDLNGESLAALV